MLKRAAAQARALQSSRDSVPSKPSPEIPPRVVRAADPTDAERESWRECERVQRAAERRTDQLRLAQARWELSDTPARYFDADLSKLDPNNEKQKRVAERMLSLIDRPGMLALVGPRGPGKTWLSCGLIREYCRIGRRAKYVRAKEIFRQIKATFARSRGEESERSYMETLQKQDLLVIDEIQVRGETQWENDELTDLIDTRYGNLLTTIIIANLEPKAFVASVGESIASRMAEDGGILICDWESYRKNGKAQPADPPERDSTSGKVQFTPVCDGAIPKPVGLQGRNRYNEAN